MKQIKNWLHSTKLNSDYDIYRTFNAFPFPFSNLNRIPTGLWDSSQSPYLSDTHTMGIPVGNLHAHGDPIDNELTHGLSRWRSVSVCCYRYAVIVHPMKSRLWCSIGRTKKIICGIWIASLLLSAPLLHVMVGYVALYPCFTPRHFFIKWQMRCERATVFMLPPNSADAGIFTVALPVPGSTEDPWPTSARWYYFMSLAGNYEPTVPCRDLAVEMRVTTSCA